LDRQGWKLGTRRGQALIMMTLIMAPLLGFLGLVTDVGYMHFVKMSAQTAAEAAAQAAMIDFSATTGTPKSCGDPANVVCSATPAACPAVITTPQNSIERGCMYAKQHGFKSAGAQMVTYQSGIGGTPPTASGMGSASYWMTFRVVQRVPQMFSALLGNRSGLVAARSTVALIGATDCIYALNPSASGAVSVGGTANLTSSCGIYVNSNSASALSTNGSAILSATEYDVVGGVSTHAPLSPTPATGAPRISDPLAYLTPPASAPYHCDQLNYSASGWSTPTLSPGVYCGGISVKNATVTLNPGTYILAGGGISTQSANSHISGNGVFIYNTFGATDKGNFTYSPIAIAATSTITLKAANSGAYAGILFFEDRAAPHSFDTFGGGSNAVYQGLIYARNAAVTMYGNSSVNARYTLLVADTISMVGTTGFNNDYSVLPTGSPIQKVAMVE
jgi:hypothetical protein